MQDKVKENRLRRMAGRQGLKLLKARRIDPRALDYGRYLLVNAQTGVAVHGGDHLNYRASMSDVDAFLTGEREGADAER